MVRRSKLEKSLIRQSKDEKEEALRLSKEVKGFVQPLMDWYQFRSGEALSKYIEKICDVRETKAGVKYSQVRSLISGEIRYLLDNPLLWIHSTMRRMYEASIGGRRESIDPKLRKKYILPMMNHYII